MKLHLPFAVLLVVFLGCVRLYATSIPAFEGPDEPQHAAYIMWIRQHGSLPDPRSETPMRQQVSQNPLYYLTASLLNLDFVVNPPPNPWHAYPAVYTLRDNRNAFLTGIGHLIEPSLQQQMESLASLRLLSSVYGVIAIAGIYTAGLILWRGRRWALFGAMLFGLTPQMLQGFAVVSNDVAVIAFSVWVITGALYLHKHPSSQMAAVLTGVMMGLAALSKTNGLMVWPVPIAILVLNRRSSSMVFILLGAAFFTGGWWYLRAFLLYGDFTGAVTHLQTPWGVQSTPDLASILNDFQNIIISIWADFGWYQIPATLWAYLLPLSILLVALLGWRKMRLQAETLALAVGVIAGVMALIAWMLVSTYVPGRLFFPVYGALVLLVIYGLRQHGQLPFLLALWAGGLGMVAVLMIPTTIYPAYGIPPLLDNAPEPLFGAPLDFGLMQFLGYQIDGEVIGSETMRRVRLCWKAGNGDEPVPVPYAFALHIVGENDTRVGTRDSYFGLGKYTAWQPNKIFCDTFDISIESEIKPQLAYRLVLNVYDPLTMESLPTVDGGVSNTIGYLRANGPVLMYPTDAKMLATFEGIGLLSYRLENDLLSFDWAVMEAPEKTLKIFAHIVDQDGTIILQNDEVAGDEDYPSWAWKDGELIHDALPLEVSKLVLETDYRLLIGLYDPMTDDRLHVTDADGNAVTDDALPLKLP